MLELDDLKKVLSYDPDSGLFERLHNSKSESYKPKGTDGSSVRYHNISINGVKYAAHSLAWFMVYGYMPSMIDHINGDTFDNRIDNLREVSVCCNNKNKAIDQRNKSGVTGVHWAKKEQSWKVQINSNKVRTHIGYFKDFFEACCARKSAERALGFHVNHGRSAKC